MACAALPGIEAASQAPYGAWLSPDRSDAMPAILDADRSRRGMLESLETRRLLSAAVQGLTGEYYSTADLTGSAVTRIDADVNFDWSRGSPVPGIARDSFSVRWRGEIQPEFGETYTFHTRSDEGVRVWVNRQLIIDAWDPHSMMTHSGSIALEAGRRYEIQIDYYERSGNAGIQLMWSSNRQSLTAVPAAALYPMNAPRALDPLPVEGRIEVEDFDYAGSRLAYLDGTAGNTGGYYRATHVDIGRGTDDGEAYYVGWTRPGEWLNYTVDVGTSDVYAISARVASKFDGGTFHIEVDGTDVTGTIAVPRTGQDQAWTTIHAGSVAMGAGAHQARLVMDTPGRSGSIGNFNWLEFTRASVDTRNPQILVSAADVVIQSGQLVPLDFGTAEEGGSSPTRTFLVRNDGNADLLLSAPSLPAGFLLAEGLTSSLAPGASDTFTVALDTAQIGQFSGSLVIDNNDQGEPRFNFGLSGEIIPADDGDAGGGDGQTSGYILTPGTGWTGPTSQPPANGTPGAPGYDANAIARWDVVPYQTFDGLFNVGVVAFHMNGIQKVSLSVEGGEWIDVTTPTLNTQVGGNGWDGVVEYWATLDASLFTSSRQIELRAIAYPTVGVPRVLESLHLNVDADGSMSAMHQERYVSLTGSDSIGTGTQANPFATIAKATDSLRLSNGLEGGTIYLEAGTHTLSSLTWPASAATNSKRWLTITRAPGLERSDVVLQGATNDNRLGAILLTRLSGITVSVANGKLPVASYAAGARLWYDNVHIDGSDRLTAAPFNWAHTGYNGGKYMTDTLMTNVRQGTDGGGTLARNVVLDGYLSDAFSSTKMLLNAVARNQNTMGSGAHADIGQYYGHFENIIWQDVTAVEGLHDTQGFFQGGGAGVQSLLNVALVNVNIHHDAGGIGRVFLLQNVTSHLFVRNSAFIGPAAFESSTFSATNVVIEETEFSVLPGTHPGVTYR